MKTNIHPLDWDLGHVPPGITWGGVDEAGRGAWAGPVVAACAVLDPDVVSKWPHVLREVRDSKRLTEEKRERLASELKMILPAWAVAEVDNLSIDRDNILEATLSAMRQSVSSLSIKPRMLFVDGDRAPRTGLAERLLVDGDATSCAVGAASILAKAHRDHLMKAFGECYPGYGFEQHKGYGTKVHQHALGALGTCSIHRLSYKPVALHLRPDEACYEGVCCKLDACKNVNDLQLWVTDTLRPVYGQLTLQWVHTLRDTYAKLLVAFSAEAH